MSTLITLQDAKDAFPRWEDFVRLSPGESPADVDARLQRAVDDAETELLEYVDVTPATINAQLLRHLHVIVRYNAFKVRHGDTDFEHKPQMVRDYEATIAMLERYRSGEFDVPDDPAAEPSPRFSISAKERRFDRWFTASDYDTDC